MKRPQIDTECSHSSSLITAGKGLHKYTLFNLETLLWNGISLQCWCRTSHSRCSEQWTLSRSNIVRVRRGKGTPHRLEQFPNLMLVWSEFRECHYLTHWCLTLMPFNMTTMTTSNSAIHFKILLAELDGLMDDEIRRGWKIAILGNLVMMRCLRIETLSTLDCIYIGRTHHDQIPGLEEEVRIGEEWA